MQLDYDEAQGLTKEMVHSYLNRKGWCNLPDPDLRLIKPAYAVLSFKDGLPIAIEKLAQMEGRPVQALLRDVNPRMRQGIPSQAAVNAHEDRAGHWLAQSATLPYRGVLRVGYFDNMMGFVIYELAEHGTLTFHKIPASWSFWPCDDHGNKVRWPERDGVML